MLCLCFRFSGKLSDYESSGQINEVLEARQQQCRILEQKEDHLLELVRDLEANLNSVQQESPHAEAPR